MRLGQTSLIHFASRFLASILGFISTVFIGRILGSSGLGTYYLVLSMIAWLGVITKFGVPGAVTKRVSEGESQSAHTIAGISISTGLFIIVAGCVLIFRDPVNNYIGYPAAEFVVLLLFVNIAQTLVNAVLKGQQLVHISGIFNPIRTGTRSVVQITALFAGLGIIGLFAGYAIGYALVVVLGTYVVVKNLDQISVPRRTHFQSIFSYAKFSWIGSLRSRAFNWVDVSILGFFVSTSLIGIYTAAWNIAVFLILFGGSLSQTLFPEMSSLSAENAQEQVGDLFETSLAFAGLILIPGLVGATVLGERLLQVYGDEFSQGAVVLSVLIIATLIQGYQRQFTTTLNAIDRPDLSFRVNAVFIIGNVILNVSIIPFYDIVGAAAATAASVAISLSVAYVLLSSQIEFSVPTHEIARQWVAAGLMGIVVYIGLTLEKTYSLIGINIVAVLILVGLGTTVYFTTLFVISARFQTTVKDNIPI